MKTCPPVIFLGPSLSIEEACKILPHAIYFPPAKCGDILHATKLKPEAIVLIDGYFENTPAVWHKEILYALEKGILVFGTASMGAIRAAELSAYGMMGIGKVFEHFNDGILADDDEVAVTHHGHKLQYQAISLPFVNIRSSLKNAVKNNLITQKDEAKLLHSGKKIHYKNRHWDKLFVTADIEAIKKATLLNFLKTKGYIDQKKLDAIATLTQLQKSFTQKRQKKTPRSLYFKGLLHFTSCEPFPYFSWKLSRENQISCISRLTAPLYLISKIAMLGSIASFIEHAPDINNVPEHIKILFTETNSSFLKEQEIAAQFAAAILKKAEEMALSPRIQHVQKFADLFRRKHGLLTQSSFEIWLIENNLSLSQFQNAMKNGALLDYLVYRNNRDALGLKQDANLTDWYLWALRLTGHDKTAEAYLNDTETRKGLLIHSFEEFTKNKMNYLTAHGFASEEEFLYLLNCLSLPQADAGKEK